MLLLFICFKKSLTLFNLNLYPFIVLTFSMRINDIRISHDPSGQDEHAMLQAVFQ